MSNQITFKRKNVEFFAFTVLLLAFIGVLVFIYYIFLYDPKIENSPYEPPQPENTR